MNIIFWKNKPIFTEIILLLTRHNTMLMVKGSVVPIVAKHRKLIV